MNDLTFDSKGWNDYLYWQTQDRKTLKKINSLLEDIKRNGAMHGMGKPELLKHGKSGLYSRRIDEANRLEYPGRCFNGSGFPIPFIAPFLLISFKRLFIFRNVFLSWLCQ